VCHKSEFQWELDDPHNVTHNLQQSTQDPESPRCPRGFETKFVSSRVLHDDSLKETKRRKGIMMEQIMKKTWCGATVIDWERTKWNLVKSVLEDVLHPDIIKYILPDYIFPVTESGFPCEPYESHLRGNVSRM
jgi:hypothetical protein